MTTNNLWESIDKQKKTYNIFFIISLIAWGVTLAILANIGYFFYIEYEFAIFQFERGLVNVLDVNAAKKNIYFVVISISIILAVLATVVVFMKQRVASLQEIQLRLTLLEQSISEEKN